MPLHFDDSENLSIKRFEKMLKTNAVYFFDAEEFEIIIEFYIDNAKVHLAKKAIELATQQHPETVGIRVLKAEIFIIEDKYSEAEKLLNELSYIEPENEEIFIQKGLLKSKQHRHQEAIELLLHALDISQNIENLDILSLIGMEYLYLEQFEMALQYFKDCLLIEPEDEHSLYNITYCYEMLEKYAEAIDFLKNYIDDQPYNETAWHHLGRQYFMLEKYHEALSAFDYAILIDEEFVGAYMEKAKILEELGQYYEAIRNYLITTRLDDPSAFAYLRIGMCYEELNNYSEAVNYYLKSSEQDPYFDRPILNIIEILFKEHKFEKSLFFINQLINIDEEHIEYWLLYAKANMKIAFFSEAAKAYEKIIKLNNHTLDVFLELSDCYNFMGEYQQSISTLFAAEVFYHNYAEIQYRISGVFFMLHDNDKGIRYLRLAHQNNPLYLKYFQKLFPTVYNNKFFSQIIENLKYNI